MRYHFAEFVFDAADLRLQGPEGERPLRPMSARLLQVLLENAPELLRHHELLDEVWGRQAVTPGVLSQSIREIRAALGDSSRDSRFIETRHRLGYCFIAEVSCEDPSRESAGNVGAVQARPASSPESPAAAARATGAASSAAARSGMTVSALLLLLVLVAAFWGPARKQVAAWVPGTDSAKVLAGEPQEPEALHWYRQGLRAQQQGDLHEAGQLLDRSRTREPDAAATLAALATNSAQTGDMLRAREWIAAAENAARSLPRVEQLRIAAERAALEYRWDGAIAHLTAISQLDPGDVESAFRLFDARLASGRTKEANAGLEALAAQTPAALDHWRLAMARARLAEARGEHASRLEAAGQALKLADSPDRRGRSRLEQAWARFVLGDRAQALAEVEELAAGGGGSLAETDVIRLEELRFLLLREAGDYPAAQAGFEDLAARAERSGFLEMGARARRMAAFVQIQAGQADAAIAPLEAVVDILSAHGNARELARAREVLALALQRNGDMPAALAVSEAALTAHVEAGDRDGEAKARNQLGMLYGRAGRNDESRSEFTTALQLFAATGDRHGEAIAQSNLAILDGRAGRPEAARERNERALAAFRELASWPEVARLEFNLAVQDRGKGRLAEAGARFETALEAFERIGSTDQARQARASLAELALMQADPAAARRILDEDPVEPAGNPQARAARLTAEGRLAALRGELDAADAAHGAALALRDAAGLPDWARMSALDLATVAARQGALAQAEQTSLRLRREMLAAADAPAAIHAGLLLGAILQAQAETAAAARLLDRLQDELAAHPDATLSLRLDLLRAAVRGEGRAELAREVAAAARAIGYELLALRADLLAGGEAGRLAQATLDRRGLRPGELPLLPPY